MLMRGKTHSIQRKYEESSFVFLVSKVWVGSIQILGLQIYFWFTEFWSAKDS